MSSASKSSARFAHWLAVKLLKVLSHGVFSSGNMILISKMSLQNDFIFQRSTKCWKSRWDFIKTTLLNVCQKGPNLLTKSRWTLLSLHCAKYTLQCKSNVQLSANGHFYSMGYIQLDMYYNCICRIRILLWMYSIVSFLFPLQDSLSNFYHAVS